MTEYKVNDIVECTVIEIRDIGAFVSLPDGRRGFIHISEVSSDYVTNVNDYLSVGQKIKAKIVSMEGFKTSLSIKQLSDTKYQVNDIVEGTVSGISDFGAFVDLPDGSRGLVHISEISDEFVKNVNNYLSIGQKVKVMITGKDGNKIALSIRKADSNLSNVKGGYSNAHFEMMLEKYMKDSNKSILEIEGRGERLC